MEDIWDDYTNCNLERGVTVIWGGYCNAFGWQQREKAGFGFYRLLAKCCPGPWPRKPAVFE